MEEEKWYNPIEDLKPGVHQLMNHLTSRLSPELQQTISDADILFVYDNRLALIVPPKAELETHRILLQDTHMAFLWCCSYITVSLNSMFYEKATLNQDIVEFKNVPEFAKIELTLQWARSLKQDVMPWPAGAGRPDVQDRWTEPATNLYQACVSYLFFHEICHIISHQHLLDLAERRLDPFYVLTDQDRKQIYDAEVESDQFALDCLKGNSTIDEVIMLKCLGAVLAQLSNFYLLDIPDTRGGTHPDYDVRLRAIMDQVDLKTEANKIQFNAHVSNGLQLFFKLTDKEFIPENLEKNTFKDFEALQGYLFGLIDQMKNAAR